MKNTIVLILAVLLSLIGNAQNVYFVKENGSGTGKSWQEASGSLNKILELAESGDEIWVGAGTFYPTNSSDRSKAFEIPDGIKLYGGFAGFETAPSQRKRHLYKSILSGEIGKAGIEDNSYTVVITKGVSEKTVIDGFTITGGNADGVGPTGDIQRCGSGWYNDGTELPSNPTIQHCIITNNEARDGAGMYNNGKGGKANPTLVNCKFLNNRSDLDGGGMFNDGRAGGQSNPTIENCLFEGNKANYGAGIFNFGGGGMSSPKLVNCRIMKNKAYVRGGAMLNMDVEGISKPVMFDTSIEDNEASVGNGVYQFSNIQGSGFTIQMLKGRL